MKIKKVVKKGNEYTITREPYSSKYIIKKSDKKSVRIREPYTHNFKVI